jgi:hypothetical protein
MHTFIHPSSFAETGFVASSSILLSKRNPNLHEMHHAGQGENRTRALTSALQQAGALPTELRHTLTELCRTLTEPCFTRTELQRTLTELCYILL